MATSKIGSIGVTFPDGTIQTTAGIVVREVPAGSVTNFFQATAPTGWTQVTTHNDYAMRIVSGSGGTTGGTTAFSTVFSNQTPTFTGAIGSLTSGATTLSAAQIPSHFHSAQWYVGQSTGSGSTITAWATNETLYSADTSAIGGGGSHSHSITGVPGGSVGPVTLNVKYLNNILCTKN